MCGQSTAPLDILNIPILLGTNMKPAAQNTDVAGQIMSDSLSQNAGLSEPALLVRNLHKTYNGGAVKVFSDVSFDIRAGEICGFNRSKWHRQKYAVAQLCRVNARRAWRDSNQRFAHSQIIWIAIAGMPVQNWFYFPEA